MTTVYENRAWEELSRFGEVESVCEKVEIMLMKNFKP